MTPQSFTNIRLNFKDINLSLRKLMDLCQATNKRLKKHIEEIMGEDSEDETNPLCKGPNHEQS